MKTAKQIVSYLTWMSTLAKNELNYLVEASVGPKTSKLYSSTYYANLMFKWGAQAKVASLFLPRAHQIGIDGPNSITVEGFVNEIIQFIITLNVNRMNKSVSETLNYIEDCQATVAAEFYLWLMK
jgi:hypothetical protein